MTLFLRATFHDNCLLPLPKNSTFSSAALSAFAVDLHKTSHTHLNNSQWLTMANKHFNLTQHQAQIYFHLFSTVHSTLCKQTSAACLLPQIQFLLFLYNQLFSLRSNHNTDIAIPSLQNKKSPKEICNGRIELSNFWSQNSKQWLNLIKVAQCGNSNSLHMQLNTASLTQFTNIDLVYLNFLYLGYCEFDYYDSEEISTRDNNGIKLDGISRLFKTYLDTGGFNESNTINKYFQPQPKFQQQQSLLKKKNEKFISVEKIFIAVATNSLPLSSRSNGTFPIDLISKWIQFSTTPKTPSPSSTGETSIPNFKQISFSKNGLAQSFKPHHSPTPDPYSLAPHQPTILISSKRNQTLLIPSHLTKTHPLILYRCHDCTIYILGRPKSILISHCRGSRIFFGPTAGLVSIRHCDKMDVTGCAGFLVVDFCFGLNLNVLVKFNPLFLGRGGGKRDGGGMVGAVSTGGSGGGSGSGVGGLFGVSDVVLGPCNRWYEGMKEDLVDAGFEDGMVGKFASPVLCWVDDDDDVCGGDLTAVYRVIEVDEYFCSKLPFWFGDDFALVVKDNEVPFSVPVGYIESFTKRTSIGDFFQSVVKDLTDGAVTEEEREAVNRAIEELEMNIKMEFSMWLRRTGRINEITGLMNLDKDIKMLALK